MFARVARLVLPLGASAALSAGLATAAAPAASGGPPLAAAGHGHAGPPATAARRRRRPGCGRFCRQAGGFGAGPDEPVGPVVMPRQTIRVASDGIIAVKATCNRSERCIGAILVDGHVSYGRADFRVAGHATRRVLVAVPSAGIKYLRKHGQDRTGFATVALTDESPISTSKALTLLPPR